MYRNTRTHNIDIRRSRCFYEGVLKSVEIFLFDPDWNIKLLTESPFNFIHTFVVSDRWIPDCDGPLAVPVHWGHLCHHCDDIHWRSLEHKLPLTDQSCHLIRWNTLISSGSTQLFSWFPDEISKLLSWFTNLIYPHHQFRVKILVIIA